MSRLLLLLLTLLIQNSLQDEGCIITNELRSKQPLFLSKETYEFIYPSLESGSDLSVTIPVGESIIISCPKGVLSANLVTLNTTETATCNNNSLFEIGSVVFNHSTIICNSTWRNLGSIQQDYSTSCGLNATLIDLGFYIESADKFIKQSKICYDNSTALLQYANFNITPYSKFVHGYIIGGEMMEDSPYYPERIDVAELYYNETLRANLNQLLGLEENSTKYFRDNLTLTYSVMSDVGSCVYTSQQMANFRFINAVPMWTSFYNWEGLYDDIRDYSINYNLNLEVYGGVSGVLKLQHDATNEPIELYLHKSQDTGAILKVPEIIWTVVHEPITQRGIVAIMHNNPYLELENFENICQDIYQSIHWISWEYSGNALRGYTYLCSYEDSKSVITELPELNITGILY